MNIDLFTAHGGSSSQRINPTSSSAATALAPVIVAGTIRRHLVLTNAGSVAIWYALGDSSVVAAIPAAGTPANGQMLMAGSERVVDAGAATHIAMITAAGTGEAYLTSGLGV